MNSIDSIPLTGSNAADLAATVNRMVTCPFSLRDARNSELAHPVSVDPGAGHWQRLTSGLVSSCAKSGDKSGHKGKIEGDGLAWHRP